MANVVNSVNKRYVFISNRMTTKYQKEFGLPCDLYFPIFDKYSPTELYRNMKIFTPHQSPSYRDVPDIEGKLFYIPHLIKKVAMNSAEAEFDSFYTEADSIDRPFIETTKSEELPISTKVVVHQGESISKFIIDKKLVVTGASGMMLLRMYLDPLAKDSDEDNSADEQIESVEGEENEGDDTIWNYQNCNCPNHNHNNDDQSDFPDELEMNIPDEDD